jgi:uncharacterized protein YndB with AHSA1/START domain
MRRIEIERAFDHPIERVFRRYTDHAGWTAWAGLGRVWRERDGSPERDGVGCVRAFSLSPGLREEVTRFDPPRRMEYRVTRGAAPIADHHGEVLFAPEGQGTRVTWRVTFRARIPGTGWALERGLGLLFRAILARLARDLGR